MESGVLAAGYGAPGSGSTSLLSQILLQNVSPVVMVLSTPLAEAACMKNNLSFVDLLRPFSLLNRINVPVRTASETPYRLQEFQLRFFYTSEIRPIPIEAAEEQLLQLVTNASETALNELNGDPENLQEVRRMVQRESISSWFQQYSIAFSRTLAFSDHEAFDHPVACLLVVSSRDNDPLNAFTTLSNAANLPALMNDGVMDPRILKHYVVLHDNQDGPPDRATDILQNICGTLDANDCSLIRINSGEPDTASSVDDLWSVHMPSDKTKENVKFGSFLQMDDIEEIQAFVIDFCLKHIIPYMEQKVRWLNQQVAATRRGLKNQIKNLWWRKKDSEIPETPSGAVYTSSSMESQIRILADYAFMLRDYELAVSNYRLLSSDYKADKALKRYAGVMEMIGLCLCLLDQSRKEADNSLETAYITYQMCGAPVSRYATRTALWWAEVHKGRGQFSEAAYVLFRAATEMDKEATLRAAVLLEQSAYCYLRCIPPMIRKYGFHLVLAGIRYHVSGQRKHAIRAYMCVLSVYDGQGWNFISDHVNLHLGRISAFLGQLEVAVQHFMKLITCDHQSAPNQALFLKEFLSAVQNLNTKDEIWRIALPAISSEHVYVRFEDHRTYASPAAARLREDIWASLEEGLVPSTAAPVTTWLDAPQGQEKSQDFNVSVAGEDILVFVQVTNPLQIAIEVSSMQLICDFQPQNESGAQESAVEEVESRETREASSPLLVLSEESFTLRGGERTEITLKAKPTEEGLLKIVGVKWLLCGIVLGRYDFPKRKKAMSKRGKKGVVPVHHRLKFHVVGHMPRLEIAMHQLPSKVNEGEIRRIVLEIQNLSHASIKNIKLKTSHPDFLMVGEQGDLDLEFPNCLEVRQVQEQEEKNQSDSKSGSGIFSFPEDAALEGASTVLWPLWLHARHNGEYTFRTVLYFEAPEAPSLKYRTVRMVHTIQVMPSLQVSVQISSSPVRLDRYLLRMDVANVHPTDSFWLRQVSCIGDDWYLSPVHPQLSETTPGANGDEVVKAAFLSASVSPSQLLPATQSSSFFFQLRRKRDQPDGLHAPDFGGNVRLGPPSSEEPVINMAYGPLSYFHQQEKLLQPNRNDKAASNQLVDLVLITGQQDDMIQEKTASSSHNTFRFATHHVCHCRAEGPQPVLWALEGPRCIGHDFGKQPICEIPVFLALRNCSQSEAAITIETSDPSEVVATDKTGWRSVSPPPTLEGLATKAETRNTTTSNSLSPSGSYMWCSSKSVTALQLKAGASIRVPLCIAVFAAGMYDVCSYRITWRLATTPAAAGTAATPVVVSKKVKISKFVPAPATMSGTSFTMDTTPTDRPEAIAREEGEDGDSVGLGTGHSFLLTVVQLNSTSTTSTNSS